MGDGTDSLYLMVPVGAEPPASTPLIADEAIAVPAVPVPGPLRVRVVVDFPKVNWSAAEVVEDSLGVVGDVTTTSTVPAPSDGDVAVIEVVLLTVTLAADMTPNFTVSPVAKPAPEIETDVPPPVPPEVGEIAVTEGITVNVPVPVLLFDTELQDGSVDP